MGVGVGGPRVTNRGAKRGKREKEKQKQQSSKGKHKRMLAMDDVADVSVRACGHSGVMRLCDRWKANKIIGDIQQLECVNGLD